jgi:ribosomal protein S18 acetylase RimI-like enzyme
VIDYRTFRNTDPPLLIELWNSAFRGRGAVQFASASPLEYFVLAKPYFDPAGLIVAAEGGVAVGIAHAGFGPNGAESDLNTSAGVTCVLGVRPTHRRRGIGSELLRRCETYLASRGAREWLAGPHWPLSPFYLGLYGGSDLPGFLASDADAEPFLLKHGYQAGATTQVLHRRLGRAPVVVDGRFPALRRRYEPQLAPRAGKRSWWRECVLGPLEPLEFCLVDKTTGQVAARSEVWEMTGFRWRWNEPAVGVLGVTVHEGLRRQGLARFLLAQMLRQLQDQYFTIAEVQVAETDEPALRLFRGLGFEPVDRGRVYRKQPVSASPTSA